MAASMGTFIKECKKHKQILESPSIETSFGKKSLNLHKRVTLFEEDLTGIHALVKENYDKMKNIYGKVLKEKAKTLKKVKKQISSLDKAVLKHNLVSIEKVGKEVEGYLEGLTLKFDEISAFECSLMKEEQDLSCSFESYSKESKRRTYFDSSKVSIKESSPKKEIEEKDKSREDTQTKEEVAREQESNPEQNQKPFNIPIGKGFPNPKTKKKHDVPGFDEKSFAHDENVSDNDDSGRSNKTDELLEE